MSLTIAGPDGKPRCRWSGAAPEFTAYHDTEWGFPVGEDRRLFEKLCLESFQSGLSWRTILAKRDNFRAAFKEFRFDEVARFTARDVKRLLADAGIIVRFRLTSACSRCVRRYIKSPLANSTTE
jgi:DNA-3-methyladenine glycosylase I